MISAILVHLLLSMLTLNAEEGGETVKPLNTKLNCDTGTMTLPLSLRCPIRSHPRFQMHALLQLPRQGRHVSPR